MQDYQVKWISEALTEIELADLKVLSGLVKRKYTRMRTAVDLAAAGVVMLGLAVVAGVLA